jgi:DNA-directed RNA polymerase subunit RPC12/RpoP
MKIEFPHLDKNLDFLTKGFFYLLFFLLRRRLSMREALHVIDWTVKRLPLTVTKEEVRNYRLLASKGVYKCPYCDSNLIVKHGEERGTYFSHQHLESCEESIVADATEKIFKTNSS